MSAFSCEQATELWDRAAIGEAIDKKQLSLAREHAARCPSCGAEARVYDALARGLRDDSTLFEGRPLDSTAPRRPAPSRTLRLALACAALAASAAAAVAFWSSPANRSAASARAHVEGEALLALAAGEVEIGGARAVAGAVVAPTAQIRVGRGRACLAYAWGATICAGDGSSLRPLGAGDEHVGVELERGSVVCRLDAKPPAPFSVVTPRGRVTATGTVFTVQHLSSDREVAVRLHRGSVEVTPPRGGGRELKAPAAIVLGDGLRPVRPDDATWKRDAALIEAAELWSSGELVPFDFAPNPPGATVSLDGFGLGESPISALVGRGEHELFAERAGFVPHRERILVAGAERVRRSPSLTPAAAQAEPRPEPEPASTTAAPSPAAPSAAELLARARSLRSAGRYAEAAHAYQALIDARPASAEARAALVSLGELQLSQLKNPEAALRSFARYLKREGTLTQEARYGRIRALRALGRHEEAREAARRFIERYPGSAQARQLQQPSGP